MNKVQVGFFSFTEITDPTQHRAYNAWHLLDHLPEQHPLDGVAFGQRWVSSPACRAARAVSGPLLDPIHYVTLYLMTEPVDRTLREFLALGADLRALGRFHRHRRAHLSGPFRLLEAAAAREIDVLYLIGVDPLRDFPDAALAQKALDNVAFKVVQDTHAAVLREHADVMLPAAPPLEKDGHFTDWEGRSQRLNAVRGPKRLARADWEIFVELAKALGGDLGFTNLEELREEMARLLAPRESAAGPAESGAAKAADGPMLFTYPLLVDEGSLSDGADELKAAQETAAFAELNAEDAAAIGIEDGGRVKVSTASGSITLPARVTANVAKGAVFIPFNQPGLAASTLLSGEFSTPVTLEGGA